MASFCHPHPLVPVPSPPHFSSPSIFLDKPFNPKSLETFAIPLLVRVATTHPKFSSFTRNSRTSRTRATLENEAQTSATPSPPLVVQEQNSGHNKEVDECVRLLKNAAKTRKVPPGEILQAFSVISKAKLDPSGFLPTLGGTQPPGRTWMLVFTAEKKLDRGKYFPITAVQRFDAAGKRIENGVYLGPLGSLTFEGRFSWNKRILAFIFERIRVKIGPFSPVEYCFKGKDEREPSNKDPFFTWFYVDEEIAVARGRSGGTAFWVRCRQIAC